MKRVVSRVFASSATHGTRVLLSKSITEYNSLAYNSSQVYSASVALEKYLSRTKLNYTP